MRTHTFTIPAPTNWISANDRMHWQPRAELVATWRLAAFAVGRKSKVAPFELARIDAHLWFRATAPRRDVANYHPTIKAVVDGLVTDAKLMPDDSDDYLAGPFAFPGDRALRPARGFVGMQVTFTELSELPTSFPDGPGRTTGPTCGAGHLGKALDSTPATDRGASAHGGRRVEGGA